MPKWKSSIITDIRNAIGDNVVFSIWKGRGYFRGYVIPANPSTNPQKAHRAVMENLVKRYQSLMADAEVKAEWNVEGLEYLISGFNVFTKFGRRSKLSVTPESGTAPLDVTITYTIGLPVAKARMYRFDGTTWTDITPAEGLSETPDSTLTDKGLAAGTYTYWIANKDVLKAGQTSPQNYQAITKWLPDEVNGVAKECKVTVS